MNGKFSINCQSDFFIVELVGAVTACHVINASRQLLNTPEFTPGYPVIWDATAADLSEIDSETIEKTITELDEMFDGLPLGHVALVSEREINLGTIDLFRVMYDKNEVSVFNSFPKAQDWIQQRSKGND